MPNMELIHFSQALLLLQSQPKVSGHPQTKALPRFPSANVATMHDVDFSFDIFLTPAKQHWAGGMGEKEATVQCYCLRLSERVM